MTILLLLLVVEHPQLGMRNSVSTWLFTTRKFISEHNKFSYVSFFRPHDTPRGVGHSGKLKQPEG
jgi:hypothetical protein